MWVCLTMTTRNEHCVSAICVCLRTNERKMGIWTASMSSTRPSTRRKGNVLIFKYIMHLHESSSLSLARLDSYDNYVLSTIPSLQPLHTMLAELPFVRLFVGDDVEKLKRMLALFIWIEFCTIYLVIYDILECFSTYVLFMCVWVCEVNCVEWHTEWNEHRVKHDFVHV